MNIVDHFNRLSFTITLSEGDYVYITSVFEIEGAPCTLCAHFVGLVHVFWNMCTRQVHAFSKFSICLYRNELKESLPGVWLFLPMHSMCAQNKSLISNSVLTIHISFCELSNLANVVKSCSS